MIICSYISLLDCPLKYSWQPNYQAETLHKPINAVSYAVPQIDAK
jgi:hypothetical protein